MGAAKKVVQLDSKATRKEPARKKVKKVELTEVVREKKPKAPSFTEYADLAKSLTREKALSHDEVEAALGAAPAPASEQPDATLSATPAADVPGMSDTSAMPPRRDMSKMALFASLVAVILLLGFYFNLNQNIKDLTQQVQDLSVIKTTVSSLDTKVGTMESKVAELETLPAKTRAALMSSILQEMTQKTSYMSTQLQSPEQQEKLMKAKELIQQVQTELNTLN
jgi:hypothetical protein